MARVDYFAIEQAIQTVLKAAPDLSGTQVVIEEELQFGSEATPRVGIYLMRRDAPSGLQALAAGQQTRFLVRFEIRCAAYSLDAVATAISLRDDLVGKVEVALMASRSLNGTVISSWLEGGDLPSAQTGDGWTSRGDVILIADVKATT
ncbi:MAG TPA: hypothetical protein VGV13_00915 [Methylomirabilota bacterium]|jgi:hypothetical protein|nr:hypothetical protein [Methylomirabilota bacterium]